MAEGTTIKADQIEGLPDLIRAQVREVLREEVKSAPEDMDQLRRSPAGTVIRLEEQVKSVDSKVDLLRSEMERRFTDLKESMDQQFSTVKWILVLIFPLLIALIGKLFFKP